MEVQRNLPALIADTLLNLKDGTDMYEFKSTSTVYFDRKVIWDLKKAWRN